MIARVRNAIALMAVASLGLGCIPSNVVAPDDRAVRIEPTDAVWREGRAEDLRGYWSSRSLSGPLSSAILRLHYWFENDGKFTGAALLSGPPPRFVVLDGVLSFDEQGQLLLGADVEPAQLEASGNLLRLTGAEGVVVLERHAIQ